MTTALARPPAAVLEAVRAHRRQPSARTEATLQRLAIRPLVGGMNNAVYAVVAPAGPYCLKLYKTDDIARAAREWRALSLLASRGLTVAPRPIWCALDARAPVVAMELLDGTPLSARDVGALELAALADTLQQIHALVPTVVDYPYTIVGAPPYRIERIHNLAEQVPAHGATPLPATMLPLLRAWLASGDPETLRLPAPPIFARGDPNLANCLWDGARVRCVDFEYAGWGDLAFELADLVEGLWARRVPEREWPPFLARFDLANDAARRRFGAARRLCALFWLAPLWERRERGDQVDTLLRTQIRRARQVLRAEC